MRILWLTIDRSKRAAKHFDVFRKAVSKIAKVDVVKIPRKICSLSFNAVDFVFCDAFEVRRRPGQVKGFDDTAFAYFDYDWSRIKKPRGILLEDLHGERPQEASEKILEYGIDFVFYRYALPFKRDYPNLISNSTCFWLPHSVDTAFFKDRGVRDKDVLFVGRGGENGRWVYPYRYDIFQNLKDAAYFIHIPRPGDDETNPWPVGEEYAKVLSSAKICVTGGSRFNYPILKYIELPASGALLISNWFEELEMLGFNSGKNMVALDFEKDLKEQVETWLNNDLERIQVAEEGRKLIEERHSVEVRAKQFLNFIKTKI